MAYRDEVLADSPLGYWRLEETSGTTLADETGNGNTGTALGDPDLTISGQVDSAMACDGDGDALEVPTVGDVNQVTVELWVKAASGAGFGKDDSSLAGCAEPDSSNIIDVWLNTDGTVGARHRTDSGSLPQVDGTTAIDDDTWHHVVYVVDTSGTHELYIDGSSEDSGAAKSGTLNMAGVGFMFAALHTGAITHETACSIDECALYTSVLSATRIQAHYDAAQDTGEPTTITFDPHTVLLRHRPLFEGVFSPHTVVLNHFKAVPFQPHIVNLLHRGNVLKGDDSEQGQATALRKLLGYGWGVPDPKGSANEKIETPRESWPIHRFHEAERLLRQEGVEEPTAQALGDALRRLGEDIHLDVKENLQRYEWHANAHTHSGLAGAEGTPVGPAEALFTVSGGGSLNRRLTSDGSIFWSRGDNYGDLAVDPVERRVYVIGRSDTDNQYIDRVVSYDFDGVEQWNIDLHTRIGDASETVWAFTLARDRSALYTVYNDGSQFGVVRIGTSDGSVSVIGKDTPSSTNFYPTATFDTDGDYLYFSDRAFHGGNRGRIIKFSLGDGHIVWEMSPDLANQHDCPLCATDTLLWAQKENGKVILVDKASGGIDSIVDLSGKDGATGGNLWKDFHNTNSLYVLGTNFTVPDTWLYRLYTLGGTIQTEELAFFEDLDMGRVVRDGEGNFFLGGGSGSTSHLMKLSPDLEVKWRINGPSSRNFCTDQGRSVHWG